MLACFIAGVALLAVSFWLRPARVAEEFALQQDYDRALEYLAVAEGRFNRLTIAQKIFADTYNAVLTNQFRLLYRQEKLDQLLELAAAHSENAAARFWSGSALFARGVAETAKEAQIAWLGRAREEFRNALQLAPQDWDAKYNYELTERLLAELRDKPTPPEQMLELLRPRPKQGEPPSRPVG